MRGVVRDRVCFQKRAPPSSHGGSTEPSAACYTLGASSAKQRANYSVPVLLHRAACARLAGGLDLGHSNVQVTESSTDDSPFSAGQTGIYDNDGEKEALYSHASGNNRVYDPGVSGGEQKDNAIYDVAGNAIAVYDEAAGAFMQIYSTGVYDQAGNAVYDQAGNAVYDQATAGGGQTVYATGRNYPPAQNVYSVAASSGISMPPKTIYSVAASGGTQRGNAIYDQAGTAVAVYDQAAGDFIQIYDTGVRNYPEESVYDSQDATYATGVRDYGARRLPTVRRSSGAIYDAAAPKNQSDLLSASYSAALLTRRLRKKSLDPIYDYDAQHSADSSTGARSWSEVSDDGAMQRTLNEGHTYFRAKAMQVGGIGDDIDLDRSLDLRRALASAGVVPPPAGVVPPPPPPPPPPLSRQTTWEFPAAGLPTPPTTPTAGWNTGGAVPGAVGAFRSSSSSSSGGGGGGRPSNPRSQRVSDRFDRHASWDKVVSETAGRFARQTSEL